MLINVAMIYPIVLCCFFSLYKDLWVVPNGTMMAPTLDKLKELVSVPIEESGHTQPLELLMCGLICA